MTTGTELVETRPDEDAAELRARLDRDGYLFFRSLLPADAVHRVRDGIVEALRPFDFVTGAPDHPMPGPRAVREVIAPEYLRPYAAVQAVQAFHELAHADALRDVATAVLGAPVLVHPRKVARMVPPDDPRFATKPHQDYRLIQGCADVLTMWVPLTDCDAERGGLRVLEGSHRLGVLSVHRADGPGGLEADLDDGGRWASTDFRAGDVLLFHSLTVHAARPNRSEELRLSADYRYQALGTPVTEASLLPHFHDAVPGWDELSRGWTSRSSIDVPPGVPIATVFAPDDPRLPAPSSRLVTLPSVASAGER